MAARNMRFFFSFHVGAKLTKKRPRYDDAINKCFAYILMKIKALLHLNIQ